MRFVLLVGCLSLCACAAIVTMRLRSGLSRKLVGFPPIHGNTTRLDQRIHSATSFSTTLAESVCDAIYHEPVSYSVDTAETSTEE